jgi:ribulose bisphosphate carboxylase small subunit
VGHDIRIKEKQKVVHETVIQKPNQEPPKLREKKKSNDTAA